MDNLFYWQGQSGPCHIHIVLSIKINTALFVIKCKIQQMFKSALYFIVLETSEILMFYEFM